MSKIDELKTAWKELAPRMDQLIDAAESLANWHDTERNRRDGSGRQDATHESIGSDARDRVWEAKQAVEVQLKLVSNLSSSI